MPNIFRWRKTSYLLLFEFLQIPFVSVSPGLVYPQEQKKLVQWKTGHIEKFSQEDDSILDEDFPIVIVFNGIHHFAATEVVDMKEVENRRANIMQGLLQNIRKLSLHFNVDECPPLKKNLQALQDIGDETSEMFSAWTSGEEVPTSQLVPLGPGQIPPLPGPSTSTASSQTTDAPARRKKFICDECFTGFDRSDYLNWHKQVNHENKRFKCPFCAAKFKHPPSLKLHISRKHTDPQDYLMPAMPSDNPSGLLIPPEGSTGAKAKVYYCSYDGCEANFNSKDRLKAHLIKAHGDKDQELESCDDCGKNFNSKELLQKHQKLSCGNKEKGKTIPCKDKDCKKKFKVQEGMEKHYKIFHTDEGLKFRCPIESCKHQCTSAYNLKQHMERLHPEQEEEEEDDQEQAGNE